MYKALRFGLLCACTALFLPFSVSAFEVSLVPAGNGEEVILISGEILEDETPQKFLKLLKDSDVTTVSFDSEGGNVMAALELGRAIRKAGLNTYQETGRECASACALLFVSGVSRVADDQTIGVHQAWFDTDSGLEMEEAVAAVQELTADMLSYLIEMGVDPRMLQFSLTTPSEDMHYLTTAQMQKLKVTLDSAASTAAPAVTQEAIDELTEDMVDEVIEDKVRRGTLHVTVRATPATAEETVARETSPEVSSKRSVEVRATPRSN